MDSINQRILGVNQRLSTRLAVWVAVFLCFAAFGGFSYRVQSQAPFGSQFKDFTAPANDDQGKRRSILKGRSGKRLANGQLEIQGMTVETFRDQSKDMIIEAPQCIFDPKTKIAFSSGELVVRTVDERFSIQGQGFRWQQDDSRLVISNEVQTVLRKRLVAAASRLNIPATQNVPKPSTNTTNGSTQTNRVSGASEILEVQSHRFDYRSDLAVFQENVRVEDEQGTLTCGILKVFFAPTDGKAERIEAERDVLFDKDDTRVTGEKAVYLLKDKLVTFSGNPKWKIAEKEGSGDIIILNDETRSFRVERNVSVKLLPDKMAPLDWLGARATTNAPPETARPVTVSADALEYNAELAVFRGNVQIADPQGASLFCQTLTNRFNAADGKLVELIADANVQFKRDQTIARGERAVYRTAEDIVTMTGNPTWKIEQGEGKADTLIMIPKTNKIRAEGNVAMKLLGPVVRSLDFSLLKPGSQTNVQTQEIEIFSDELQFKASSAIFLNRVRLIHPQQRDQEVTCTVLAAFFVEPDGKLDQIIAEENVAVRQGDLRAIGEKVDYWVAKGTMELTGKPQLSMPGRRYNAERFILDRANGTFGMKGNYKVEIERDAVESAHLQLAPGK
ncbi:MAG: hypothetical protein FJ403_14205 [Verrucomicrobia bacterium]|nr:hypothetical protein [Verrucomicrobiota bacterium]